MAEKKFKGAPFGTQSARFDVSGVHPASKRVGTYTQISYCERRTSDLQRNLGPGIYNPDTGDFSAQAVKERAKGPGWKRAQETARLAQTPHLLYRDAWENKQFLKNKVGPGTYRITSFIEELEKKPGSLRGICETREERFKDCQSWTPGPGTYGREGVPSAALKEKKKRSIRTHPSMDCSTNLQHFPDSSVTFPGPGSYDVTPMISRDRSSRSTPAPFLSFTPRVSKKTEAQLNKNYNTVGPGRYNIANPGQSKCANGHSSSFISGTQRYSQCPARDKYLQERLRPLNVPLDQQLFLVQPEGPVKRGWICSSA